MKAESKLLLPLLLVLTALSASCSSVFRSQALSGTVGGWYAVSANATPFYRYGPQQGKGPDMQLPRDSIMKVVRPSFGYVKVQLQDGENGYVASEDIQPASPALVAEKLAPPPPLPPPVVAGQEAGQEEQFQLNSNDPRLIVPPEPLPETSPTP
jgi:hypothetical protein